MLTEHARGKDILLLSFVILISILMVFIDGDTMVPAFILAVAVSVLLACKELVRRIAEMRSNDRR